MIEPVWKKWTGEKQGAGFEERQRTPEKMRLLVRLLQCPLPKSKVQESSG
jgi:hypothetical protein